MLGFQNDRRKRKSANSSELMFGVDFNLPMTPDMIAYQNQCRDNMNEKELLLEVLKMARKLKQLFFKYCTFIFKLYN